MKNISQKVLSLPPYLSTSWENVGTLHMRDMDGKKVLAVLLRSGSVIEVPVSGFKEETIREIFETHARFLATSEQDREAGDHRLKEEKTDKRKEPLFSFLQGDGPSRIPVDYFEAMLQHNPEQAHAPDLPKALLEKVASVSLMMGADPASLNIPKPEPHCNCTYCQIARAIHAEDPSPVEEAVSDEDLTFREWDIEKKGDQLYEVTNPLNRNEHYQVFLGDPVGCTCGRKDCEHIRTVLSS